MNRRPLSRVRNGLLKRQHGWFSVRLEPDVVPTPVLEVTDKLAHDPVVTCSFHQGVVCQHRAARLVLHHEHGDLLLEELIVHRDARMTNLVIFAPPPRVRVFFGTRGDACRTPIPVGAMSCLVASHFFVAGLHR